MARTPSNMIPLQTQAPDFDIRDTVSGKMMSLSDLKGEKGTVIYFICNHCPFVLHVNSELVRVAQDYMKRCIGFVAISSNDVENYPDDAPHLMEKVAKELGYPFPYLLDETQEVAKAYGAVCTPDFFGYNASMQLQYRGRLDASRKEAAAADVRRDLFEAMKQVAETGQGPEDQIPSMGCSIKWKSEAA